ncbi:MAG: HAMP domain-containing protein [Deltaproteobacteria bacterium]|nr:HAMP domain-containing protein [Deltaproteobacteria bacterium]
MRLASKYPLFLLITTLVTAGGVFVALLTVLRNSIEREITKRGEATVESFALANTPLLLTYPAEGAKTRLQFNLLAVAKNPDVLHARLADDDGTIIASLEKEEIGQALPSYLTASGAPTTFVDPAESAYHFRAPVRYGQTTLGTFVLSLSRTPVQAAVQRTMTRAFGFAGGIAAIICIVALLWVRREMRPLKAMRITLSEIVKGDFARRMPEDSRDEIGELAVAFNQMLDRSALFFRYVDQMIIDRMIADPSLAAPGGRQQNISVIFGDMRGYTAMSNRRKPHEVVHIVNTYFHLFIEAVAHFGGLVDKTMGDAIMAVFEARADDEPEGHKRRALLATCYMKAAARVLNHFLMIRRAADEQMQVEPREFGFAIATGTAIVGNIGSRRHMDYTVCGRVVNLASRLEGLTSHGEVIIDNFTRLGTGDLVRAEPLPPVQPKGFSEAEKVVPHRVTGVTTEEAHKLRIFLKKTFGYSFLFEMVMPKSLPAGEQAPWCAQAELLLIKIITETPVEHFFVRVDVESGRPLEGISAPAAAAPAAMVHPSAPQRRLTTPPIKPQA